MKYGAKRILGAVLLFVVLAVLAQHEAWSRVAALGMMVCICVGFWGADDLSQRRRQLKADRKKTEWERTSNQVRLQNVSTSQGGVKNAGKYS